MPPFEPGNGEEPYVAPADEEIEIPASVDDEIKESYRARMPETSIDERVRDFREVELGFTKEVALAEACRCLRCDIKEIMA